MLNDPLIKSLLTNITEDENSIKVVECLTKDIKTDEEIAEKTGIKLNVVRRILYKLYDNNLATYKRDKDSETNWFTYEWTFEKDEVINRISAELENTIKQLKEYLNEEENNMFFICPEQHVRLDFDIAQDYQFICPECGEDLEFFDNSDLIEQCKEEIKICEKNYAEFLKQNKK